MKISKLFGVLVLGGTVTGLGCDTAPGPDPEDRDVVTDPDAEPGADAGSTEVDGGMAVDAREGTPCFCDFQLCCARDEEGTGTLEAGFTCCWGTVC